MIKQFSVSAMLVLFADGALTAPFAYAEDGESKTKDPKTRVCKRVQQTGTHFTRRCFTQARWDEMLEVAQEELRRAGDIPQAQTQGEGA